MNNRPINSILIFLVPSEKAYLGAFMMPPLSMGMLTGYLKSRGHQVRVIDLNITLNEKRARLPKSTWDGIFDGNRVIAALNGEPLEKNILDGMNTLLEGYNTADFDIIGISTGANLSFFEIHFAFLLGKWIKEHGQKEVVLGGGNIQYLLEYEREFPPLLEAAFKNFPYIIAGPGEFALAELLEKRSRGAELQEFYSIPGMLQFKDQRIVREKPSEPVLGSPDFDEMDLRRYSLCLHKHDKEANARQIFKQPYPLPVLQSEKNRAALPPEKREEKIIIPYAFNFDCPYKCAFCAQSGRVRSGIDPRAAADIAADIETLANKYATPYFFFFNNAFNSTREFVIEFCAEVSRRNLQIYWSDCARFENLDKELLEKMAQAGCRKLVFGLESASAKLLKTLGKPIRPDMAHDILKACKEVGIWCDIDIITGLPYEDTQDFEQTYAFIENHLSFINVMRINKLYILPSSGLGRNPGQYGIKIHRLKQAYERLLEKSRGIYNSITGDTDKRYELVSAANCYLYSYSELNGRSHKDVFTETGDRYTRLQKLAMKKSNAGVLI